MGQDTNEDTLHTCFDTPANNPDSTQSLQSTEVEGRLLRRRLSQKEGEERGGKSQSLLQVSLRKVRDLVFIKEYLPATLKADDCYVQRLFDLLKGSFLVSRLASNY